MYFSLQLLFLSVTPILMVGGKNHGDLANPDLELHSPNVPGAFPISLETGVADIYIRGKFVTPDLDSSIFFYISFSNTFGFPLDVQVTYEGDFSVMSCQEKRLDHNDQEGFRCTNSSVDAKYLMVPGQRRVPVDLDEDYEFNICLRQRNAMVHVNGEEFFFSDIHANKDRVIKQLWIGGFHQLKLLQIDHLEPNNARVCKSE